MNAGIVIVGLFCALHARGGCVELLGLNGRAASLPVTQCVFGGEDTSLDLALEAPLGATVELRVDLIQFADDLAAFLKRDIVIGKEVSFRVETRRKITSVLTMPQVRSETQIAAVFRAKSTGDNTWRRSGRVVFTVYSRDELKAEIQRAIGAQTGVFGHAKVLREFLHSLEIAFFEAGETLPAQTGPDRTYLGDANTEELAAWIIAHPEFAGRMIVFSEAASSLPGVYATSRGSGSLIKVNLPSLAHLSSDPSSQKTLIQILDTR